MPWDFVLILACLGTLVPWRGTVRIKKLLTSPALSSHDRLSLYVSTIISEWVIVAIIAWRALARGMSPAHLGLDIDGFSLTAILAAALTLTLCASQWASLKSLARASSARGSFMYRFMDKIMPRNSIESLTFAALACTAGLAEEFIYRGFVFAVFVALSSHSRFHSVTWIAALISSVFFAAAHLYQGRRGIITTCIVGLLFCGVRIWAGNLFPSSIAHIGTDLVAGLYGPHLLRSGSELKGENIS
jgi:CAAX protease family protein